MDNDTEINKKLSDNESFLKNKIGESFDIRSRGCISGLIDYGVFTSMVRETKLWNEICDGAVDEPNTESEIRA